MTREQSITTDTWWNKMRPLVNKFSRETILAGLDKEDIKQECYLIMQKALEKYDGTMGVPFESYYKIMLYGWRSNENKKRKLLFVEDDTVFNDNSMFGENVGSAAVAQGESSVEGQIERKIILEKLYREIEKLNYIEKEIIVGYYLKSESIKAIAKRLGFTYKKVEYKKAVILKKLYSFLEDYKEM